MDFAARSAAETKRSGGHHSKAFGFLRGKQKARIFVYPVRKRGFSFGGPPSLSDSDFSAAAEFRISQSEMRRQEKFLF